MILNIRERALNLADGNPRLLEFLNNEIPVPMVALETVCNSLTNYQQQLQRARELGLIEISPEAQEENQVYRVSRILPHIIPHIRLPEPPEVFSLSGKAHDKLHELWGNQENSNEERWREIFRLLFADKENSERFRQGFSEMLTVQYNGEADGALESEMRRLKEGNLPALYIKRSSARGGGGSVECPGGGGGWRVVCWDGAISLFSRIET